MTTAPAHSHRLVRVAGLPLEIWALLAVQVLFASNAVIGRLVLQAFTPVAVMAMRISGAAAVFWLLGGRAALRERFSPRDRWLLLAAALLGLVFNQALFLLGLSLSTATNAAIISTSIPVFTVALSMAVGDERLTAAKVLGLTLALSGALVLVGIEHLATAHWADLLFVANGLSFAAYLVLTRRLTQRHAPMVLSRWTFLIAAILTLPLIAVAPLTHLPPGVGPSAWSWAGAFWLVLGPTVLAYLFNAYALQRVPSSTVASYVYLQPAIAAAMAAPLLGERPGARTAIGGALIFLGVLVVSFRPRR